MWLRHYPGTTWHPYSKQSKCESCYFQVLPTAYKQLSKSKLQRKGCSVVVGNRIVLVWLGVGFLVLFLVFLFYFRKGSRHIEFKHAPQKVFSSSVKFGKLHSLHRKDYSWSSQPKDTICFLAELMLTLYLTRKYCHFNRQK